MKPVRHRRPQHHRRRAGRGFTMVELLVVITVLVILIGLLLPAINSATIKVRHTAVQAEINRLATSVVSFKTKYGGDPPSTILLYETGEITPLNTSSPNWGWDVAARQTERTRSRAIIRQLWPQFAFTLNRDLNGDGDSNDVIVLESGESLVFFLGGLPDRSSGPGKFGILPFSRNPQNPFSFASNANRDKAVYDFEPSRLVDLDMDGFPEFLDSYPGQQAPIIYFSSYDGNGYRVADYPGNQSPVNKTIPIQPYQQGNSLNSPAFNKSTFQLISPGLDHEYGPGGPYEQGANTPLPRYDRTGTFAVSVEVVDRRSERDNITNFGNGPLVP